MSDPRGARVRRACGGRSFAGHLLVTVLGVLSFGLTFWYVFTRPRRRPDLDNRVHPYTRDRWEPW